MEAKPIPAFYCCYLLRSTVQRAFNYIGSTPNMLRRLKQHNGETKGGAKRTSRNTLKPWEVACIVHGFPSKIAALQFEWAWQNTHVSRHAKHEDEAVSANVDFRVSPRSGKIRKRKTPTGKARSITDRISHLHTLLRARSFERWPLSLRFFATDVHRVWKTIDEKMETRLPDTLEIVVDPNAVDHYERAGQRNEPAAREQLPLHGVENLDFGFASYKSYLEKCNELLARDHNQCSQCRKSLEQDHSLHTVCTHEGCDAVTHLHCLSSRFAHGPAGGSGEMIPKQGTCPSCKAKLSWDDVVRALTLRERGEKEVAIVLKKGRARKTAKALENETEDLGVSAMTMEEAEEENSDDFKDFEEWEAEVAEPSVLAAKLHTTQPHSKAVAGNSGSGHDDFTPLEAWEAELGQSQSRTKVPTSQTAKRGRPAKVHRANQDS